MRGRITLIFFISCFLFCPLLLSAQQLQISGKVTAKSDGSPLPGVSVLVRGTKIGTSTNASGEFNINVPTTGSVLVFSLIGMKTYNYTVNDNKPVNIALEDESSILNEVVVVGYGTQKKSVVTGAISGVKAADLENQQISRVEQALQGRASGVTIASASGAPGSSATVRVRGITSLNSNNPLYVIDGVVVDVGGIDYLNQNDIESIEVLKDAASAAIYGARSAGGVILVTTKKGKAGSVQLNYNGYYGTQAPARRLELLNAEEYATLRNEIAASNATPTALPFPDPKSLGKGTNWQDALFNNNAQIQNHEVSVSGGGEKSTFYTSFGYFDQEGIVATEISNYKRYNLRINTAHKLKDWLNIGQNIGYSHIKSQGGLGTNTEFGGPLSSAINLSPTIPLIITDPAVANAAPYSTLPVVRDPNGNPYGIPVGFQEMTNPLAYIQTRLGNYGWSDNIVGNVYAELEPIKGLKVRSTLGAKLAYWGGENFTPIFFLSSSGGQSTTQTSFSRDRNQVFNWNLENTVTYTREIANHNFSVLVGQGAYLDNNTSGLNVTFNKIAANTFKEATFNLKVPVGDKTTDAYDGVNHTVNSIFSRITYDYDERYLFTGIIRRDGSSKFGSNNKYGFFPSASVGWVPTREKFWPQNKVVNLLKIRGSYGVTGNDELGNFRYLPTVGSNRNYVFGQDQLYIGYSPDAPANPDLRWEETSQLNIGIDAHLFQNWTLTVDWFNKKTSGILRPINLPGYFGSTGRPFGNVADMTNKGVEVELGFRKQLGEFNLDLRGNASYIKNNVPFLGTNLGTPIDFIEDGASNIQNIGNLQRTAIGQPYNSFYGYRTNGIFQNYEEIASYVNSKGVVIQPNARPGDFKWSDLNDDGKINADDRAFLGSAIPNFTYGLTFNAAWKNFDFLLFGQGVSGNKIFQGLRRLDVASANWTSKALGRWTGEGSTNSYPALRASDPNNNFKNPSDFYLEDGSYFRIKTLQLGYKLPSSLTNKAHLNRVRVYVSSNNLVTFTKYSGFDPEIGGGPDVFGVDAAIYPQARSFTFGINVGL